MKRNFAYKLYIDTAGQERFHSIPQNLLREADGVLLVFDLMNRARTFNEGLPKMLELVKNNGIDYTSLILVGNKADAEKREVTRAEAEEYAQELGVRYIETSAKTGQNIEQLFEEIAREIYDTLDLSDIETYISEAAENIVQLTDNAPGEKHFCKKMYDWVLSFFR